MMSTHDVSHTRIRPPSRRRFHRNRPTESGKGRNHRGVHRAHPHTLRGFLGHRRFRPEGLWGFGLATGAVAVGSLVAAVIVGPLLTEILVGLTSSVPAASLVWMSLTTGLRLLGVSVVGAIVTWLLRTLL